MFGLPQVLSSERLKLCTLNESDADFIFSLLNSPGWKQFIGDRLIHSSADALSYIKKINENPEAFYWMVQSIETKEKLGVVTLIRRDYLRHADIGFAFLPEHQKNGFAFEAVKCIIDAIATSTNQTKIAAITIPENSASIQLLLKLNFAQTEIIHKSNEELLLFELEFHNSSDALNPSE